ncbi:hypothetical protein Ssi03_35920 [Sphaerisporangium siamense]|uniref:Putative ester cyclase n=1 Tax=Sphaerisporangium siamense TaxID=795645 RepID=A0A7W7D7L4_9ACTN|nr:ester cyclase [Sphaerisporangium siamense]MBB4701479.1 putative ester cyclase [Sphaerisporangium siamense]GII85602.1 hypothetical protein Ssi03_35920 [Sphaerisporangium siamense]
MSHSDFTDRFVEAWNAHDIAALVRMFHPDGVMVTPGGVGEDHEQIASMLEQFMTAFPDIKLTLWTALPSGESTALEMVLSGTHLGSFLLPGGGALEPTGRPIAVRTCTFTTLEGGRIISHRVFFDQFELATQLGCTLQPPEEG